MWLIKYIGHLISLIIGCMFFGTVAWIWVYFDELSALNQYSTVLTEELALPWRKYLFNSMWVGVALSLLTNPDD